MTDASVEQGERQRCKEHPTVPESADISGSCSNESSIDTEMGWMCTRFSFKIPRQKVAVEVDG